MGLDKLNWRVKMPIGGGIDFNKFCGAPPVHVVMYTLKNNGVSDRRHITSRKNYFFRLVFWSSKKRPAWERVSQIVGSPCRQESGHQRDTEKMGMTGRPR